MEGGGVYKNAEVHTLSTCRLYYPGSFCWTVYVYTGVGITDTEFQLTFKNIIHTNSMNN